MVLKASYVRAHRRRRIAADRVRSFPLSWRVDMSCWKTLAGAARMCSIKDKTAETQANRFLETIVDVLKYPRNQAINVLSDNTAA